MNGGSLTGEIFRWAFVYPHGCYRMCRSLFSPLIVDSSLAERATTDPYFFVPQRQMKDHIQTINRIATKFIICKRARVLVLLKLWPEGEQAVKLEMRTGKRIRCSPPSDDTGVGLNEKKSKQVGGRCQ